MTVDRTRDRREILRRRARFVASALSGLMISRALSADVAAVPECPPEKQLSDEERDTVRALFQRSQDLYAAGEYAHAIDVLDKVYELSANPRVLVALAQVLSAAGDHARALTEARRALSCAPNDLAREKLTRIVERADQIVGSLQITSAPEGAELELDGKPIGKTPLAEPLIVNAGRHELKARWVDEKKEATHALDVESGSTVTVHLTPSGSSEECENHPCVCLQPCLQPPLDPEPLPHFGLGLGYMGWFDFEDDFGHGAHANFFYETPLAPKISLRMGLSVTPTYSEQGSLVPIGAELVALMRRDPVVVGINLSGGWIWVDEQAPETREQRVPRTGAFIAAPGMTLGLRASSRVTFGIQASPVIALMETDGNEQYGLAWLRAGAFFTYGFGAGCERYGVPVECEEDELQALVPSARF